MHADLAFTCCIVRRVHCRTYACVTDDENGVQRSKYIIQTNKQTNRSIRDRIRARMSNRTTASRCVEREREKVCASTQKRYIEKGRQVKVSAFVCCCLGEQIQMQICSLNGCTQ